VIPQTSTCSLQRSSGNQQVSSSPTRTLPRSVMRVTPSMSRGR
jgi:hypothetical protein